MAINKRKPITSCKLLFSDDGSQFVEVEWANQVLEDGVVISSNPHRGAYPVDPLTGNPDQSAQTVMGIKLSKLFSNAGDNAQAQLLIANNNLIALQASIDDLKQQKIEVKESLNALKLKTAAAKQEKQDLRKRLKDNSIDETDIPVVDVGDLTPVEIS